MRTIFKLEKCYLKEHCRMREHGFIRPAGYLDLGFFSSRKKAEELMRQYISDTDNSNTFAFFITEKAVDKVRYISHLAHESCYSYTADGILNDYTDVATDTPYHGRTPDQIHFQVGDIVEMTTCDGIQLCIVGGVPWTVEECQKRLDKCRDRLRQWLHREPTPQEVATDYPLDDTDDTYRVLEHYGNGAHEHPSPVNLFKPTRKITKAQRELLVSQMLEKNE